MTQKFQSVCFDFTLLNDIKIFQRNFAISFQCHEASSTLLNKFENAILLLRLGLPSTLQRLYLHKKIRKNGTF